MTKITEGKQISFMVNGNGISESEFQIIRVWPDQRKCYLEVVSCPWTKCYANIHPVEVTKSHVP